MPRLRTRSRRFTAFLSVTCAAMAVSVAAACLWDRDTLRVEADGLPGVMEAAVGRFEREPAVYYEARLARAMGDIEKDAGDWRSWDDAIVALDKLDRCDEAVEMARQHVTNLAAAGAEPSDDDRYRAQANLGTVLAHRWIKARVAAESGAVIPTDDLVAARDAIAAAIEINPEAHFGREDWQRVALDWLIDGEELRAAGDDAIRERVEDGFGVPTLFDIVHTGSFEDAAIGTARFDASIAASGLSDPVEGLVGMVTLGAGWNSIDLLLALTNALDAREYAVAASVVRFRVQELLDAGRRPLHPATALYAAESRSGAVHWPSSSSFVDLERPERYAGWYADARSDTEAWHVRRAQWVEGRLASHHPDRDADFRDGLPAAPELAYPAEMTWRTGIVINLVIYLAIVGLVVFAVIWGLRRLLRSSPPATV